MTEPLAKLTHTKLPTLPESVQIEIELATSCNARCTACPRSEMPVAGLMREETLERIIEVYKSAQKSSAVNRLSGKNAFPRVVIAGGGEPTLHPRVGELIKGIVRAGFSVHLITNGSRLSQACIQSIVESRLSSISVSFWGVKKDEYETAMKLPFESTLARVRNLHHACQEARIQLQIVWVRSPEIKSSDKEIKAFWDDIGVAVDLSDPIPWNRGGLVGPPTRTHSQPGEFLPDPSKRIWCTDLFFSDSYRWNGDCILCCCNFFKRIPIKLGNIHENSLDEIIAKKDQVLSQRPIPGMCQVCEVPRANRARWLAAPWLDYISPEERAMLLGPQAIDDAIS